MKVYKLGQKELKRLKVSYTISGLLSLLVCGINIYLYVMGYSSTSSGAAVFGVVGFTMLVTVPELGKFYFELDGTVLTSYIRGKMFSQHDLVKVEVVIKDKKKKSKITISENGKTRAIHKPTYIGVDAFSEMMSDVKAVLQQAQEQQTQQ